MGYNHNNISRGKNNRCNSLIFFFNSIEKQDFSQQIRNITMKSIWFILLYSLPMALLSTLGVNSHLFCIARLDHNLAWPLCSSYSITSLRVIYSYITVIFWGDRSCTLHQQQRYIVIIWWYKGTAKWKTIQNKKRETTLLTIK